MYNVMYLPLVIVLILKYSTAGVCGQVKGLLLYMKLIMKVLTTLTHNAVVLYPSVELDYLQGVHGSQFKST